MTIHDGEPRDGEFEGEADRGDGNRHTHMAKQVIIAYADAYSVTHPLPLAETAKLTRVTCAHPVAKTWREHRNRRTHSRDGDARRWRSGEAQGIAAPSEVPVHRKEVYEEIQRSNKQALTKQSTPLPKLAGRLPKLKAAAAI